MLFKTVGWGMVVVFGGKIDQKINAKGLCLILQPLFPCDGDSPCYCKFPNGERCHSENLRTNESRNEMKTKWVNTKSQTISFMDFNYEEVNVNVDVNVCRLSYFQWNIWVLIFTFVQQIEQRWTHEAFPLILEHLVTASEILALLCKQHGKLVRVCTSIRLILSLVWAVFSVSNVFQMLRVKMIFFTFYQPAWLINLRRGAMKIYLKSSSGLNSEQKFYEY